MEHVLEYINNKNKIEDLKEIYRCLKVSSSLMHWLEQHIGLPSKCNDAQCQTNIEALNKLKKLING